MSFENFFENITRAMESILLKPNLNKQSSSDNHKIEEPIESPEEVITEDSDDSVEAENKALEKNPIIIKIKDINMKQYVFTSFDEININKEDIFEIDCSSCCLDSLYFLDERYINVENFYCSNNRLLRVLNNIHYLVNLRNLICSECDLISLQGCETLKNLEYINFSHNRVKSLEHILKLKKLRNIIMDFNDVRTLPLSLIKLDNFNIFSYSRQRVRYIPEPVKRWLRKEKITFIYSDIDIEIEKYVYYMFKSKNDINDVDLLTSLWDDVILNDETKGLLVDAIMSDTIHPYFQINTRDLFVKMWCKIQRDNNRHIRKKMNTMITIENFDTINKQFYTLVDCCFNLDKN